ncbi:MAG: restriction endonuclease subunit S [Paludibacter sp.]|nr:restriction endonuclease subunit S [Paludibacter sp.]
MSIVKKTLGELCIIEKGKIGIQKAIPGEFPLVVTAEERLSHNEYHFEGNAVVIPLVSSTGHGHKSLKRIHFQTGKFAVGNILCAVMPKDETVLNAEYLYRFLDLNREKELVGRMKGMANVSLPLKEIALIEIPLPPVAEQLKFVEEYKQLETAKNKLSAELTHQLTLVKQLRQSFLREAMQGKLTADFRSAHPELTEGENSAQALLEKIKVNRNGSLGRSTKKEKQLSPIGADEIPFDIPEGWVWCRLGEIGKTQTGTTPPTDNKSHFGKYIPFIKPADITLSVLNFENEGLSQTGLEKGVLIEKNSLLMVCIGGSIGKSFYTDIRVSCNQQINAISPYFNIKAKFLQFWVQSTYFQKTIWKRASGGTTPIVNKSKWEGIPIPLPPLSEQQAIVSKLDELMRTCDELEASIRTSQKQNEMLLREVLRGALEV